MTIYLKFYIIWLCIHFFILIYCLCLVQSGRKPPLFVLCNDCVWGGWCSILISFLCCPQTCCKPHFNNKVEVEVCLQDEQTRVMWSLLKLDHFLYFSPKRVKRGFELEGVGVIFFIQVSYIYISVIHTYSRIPYGHSSVL